jgi:[acyl-carrier-protein] S-malonyltransferase
VVDLPVGTLLDAGDAVGTLVSLRDELPVVAPHGGTVVEWLVEDGDPVSPGQPIVRLHPEAVGH